MGVLNRETREIHAKIVYYGPEGCGKSANLELIHRKLKREHRGELVVTPVPEGRGAQYEFLPVTLGQVRSYATSIHIYTVPGGDAHAELRRQLLDGVDGIVFVADLRPDRHDATLASAIELRDHLESYGRSFDDVVLMTQYNRRDQVDENALETLHKRLQLNPAASFEAVACEGTGVLQALTTLSKQILSTIRRAAEAPPPAAAAPPAVSAGLDSPTKGFRIDTVGPAEGTDSEARVSLQLIDEESGRKVELVLRLSLGRD